MIFDALNHKFPAEGIKKDSHNFEVFYVLRVTREPKVYYFVKLTGK